MKSESMWVEIDVEVWQENRGAKRYFVVENRRSGKSM